MIQYRTVKCMQAILIHGWKVAFVIALAVAVTGCGGELVSVNGEGRLPPGGFLDYCNRNPTVPECGK